MPTREEFLQLKEFAKQRTDASSDWQTILFRLQQQEQLIQRENERLKTALYRIAEYLNPDEQFKNGDEQTIRWITQIVKSVFKEKERETLFGFPVVEVDTLPPGVATFGWYHDEADTD